MSKQKKGGQKIQKEVFVRKVERAKIRICCTVRHQRRCVAVRRGEGGKLANRRIEKMPNASSGGQTRRGARSGQ